MKKHASTHVHSSPWPLHRFFLLFVLFPATYKKRISDRRRASSSQISPQKQQIAKGGSPSLPFLGEGGLEKASREPKLPRCSFHRIVWREGCACISCTRTPYCANAQVMMLNLVDSSHFSRGYEAFAETVCHGDLHQTVAIVKFLRRPFRRLSVWKVPSRAKSND